MDTSRQESDGQDRGARLRRLAIAVSLLILAGLGYAALTWEPGPFEGDFASYVLRYDPPRPAGMARFTDASGASLSLADFRGEVVLLNFWATWCVPCIREMPSLERLQRALGPEGLRVLAVSQDRKGRAAIDSFYAEHGLTALGIYWDRDGSLAADFEVKRLPVSFLIDGDGRILGRVLGAVAWDGAGAKRLIRYYLSRGD